MQIRNLTNDLNIYDVYRRCLDAGDPLPNDTNSIYGESIVGGQIKKYKKFFTAADYTPWLYNHPLKKGVSAPPDPLGPCTFGVPMIEWANLEEVRHLLHIPDDV